MKDDFLTRAEVDKLLGIDNSKRCATMQELELIKKAMDEKAKKDNIPVEKVNIKEILDELNLSDINIKTKEEVKKEIEGMNY